MSHDRSYGGHGKLVTQGEQTALRLIATLPVWIGRYLSQSMVGGPPHPVTILLDLTLVAGHLWATKPYGDADPNRIGSRMFFTWHLDTPLAIAGFLLARDVFWALRGKVL